MQRKDSCFETSLAWLLGVAELDIPWFTKDDPKKWLTNAMAWLKEGGFVPLYVSYEKGGVLTDSGEPFIAVGASLIDPAWDHAVVMVNDKIVFDPGCGIDGEPIYCLFVFNPVRNFGAE